MGTEILRPQDCLIERIRGPPPVFSRRRNYGSYCNYNNFYVPNSSKPSRKPVNRPERKKVVVPPASAPEPSISKRSSSDDSKMAKGSGLVMEKVTILRRGQSLDSKIRSEALKMGGDNDLVVCGTQRLGPDPEMVPKQIRIMNTDVYAGSAFAVSPSPSALPLPSFSKKKQCSAVVDDSATRDLRRLLRLE